jgi:hypothetical protein
VDVPPFLPPKIKIQFRTVESFSLGDLGRDCKRPISFCLVSLISKFYANSGLTFQPANNRIIRCRSLDCAFCQKREAGKIFHYTFEMQH